MSAGNPPVPAPEDRWVDSMPEVYDRQMGPVLFEPFARYAAPLVAALGPGRVLELAAGSGIATAELVRALPEAEITATDLNSAMVTWAAERVSGARWEQADAQRLPFPDQSFDVVFCQFGVMFFPDKPAAFAEAARVLRPHGTLVFLVWDVLETSPLTAAVVDSLATLLPEDPPSFIQRVPHGYSDEATICADLRAGGLEPTDIDRVVLTAAAPSAASLAEGFCLGSPLRFALAERGSLESLTQQLSQDMTRKLGSGPVEGNMAAFVYFARRA